MLVATVVGMTVPVSMAAEAVVNGRTMELMAAMLLATLLSPSGSSRNTSESSLSSDVAFERVTAAAAAAVIVVVAVVAVTVAEERPRVGSTSGGTARFVDAVDVDVEVDVVDAATATADAVPRPLPP